MSKDYKENRTANDTNTDKQVPTMPPHPVPDVNEGNQRNDIERQTQQETNRPVDKFNGPLTGDDMTDKQNRVNQLKALGKDVTAEEAELERLKKQR